MTVLRFNSLAHADAFATRYLVGHDWMTFYGETQVCIVCEDTDIDHERHTIAGLLEETRVPWTRERISHDLTNDSWDNFFARAIVNSAMGEVVFSHIS